MGHTFINKLFLILMVIGSIILGVYVGFKLTIIWLPFIFAWGISSLLHPLVDWTTRKTRLPRSLVTLFFLILFIGIFLGILSGLGYLIVDQLSQLINKFPEIQTLFEDGNFSLSDNLTQLVDLFPPSFREGLKENLPNIMESINMSLTTILAALVGIIAVVPNLLVAIIVMFVAAFFMTKDKTMLLRLKKKVFGHSIFQTRLLTILREDVWMVFLGYVRAQLILMTITFTEVSIGLLILKIPYAILIALGIGLLDALPVFGTGAVFIPWAIILIFLKNYTLAFGILTVYLVATLTRQSLEPKIISTQIGIHPLITLTVIYTGIKVFGVMGIVIAPLIGITLLAIKKSEILKLDRPIQ